MRFFPSKNPVYSFFLVGVRALKYSCIDLIVLFGAFSISDAKSISSTLSPYSTGLGGASVSEPSEPVVSSPEELSVGPGLVSSPETSPKMLLSTVSTGSI